MDQPGRHDATRSIAVWQSVVDRWNQRPRVMGWLGGYLCFSDTRLFPLLVFPLLSCRTLDSFETSPTGAYCGQIVGSSFVREGFDRELALEFKLDLPNLNTIPGYLTSADSDIGPCAPLPLFASAPLRAPRKLESDALSTLNFGDSALHTFVAWVDSTCQGTFLAVASLMQDRSVELRLLQGRLNTDGNEAGPFGLFRLKRSETACWER
jgi:hypothetical protein